MLANIFSLALQGVLRKTRSSVLIFLTLLFSFSCAIVTLSLTGSIRDTNAEYRLNTFGEWYVAVTDSTAEDGAWLEAQEWARTVAHTQVYGRMINARIGFGTVDQAYLNMGRAKLVAGRLPGALDEIAVEERILHDFGIETYNLGQKITLLVNFPSESIAPSEGDTGALVIIDRTFTLCGVFQDFNSLWTINDPAVSAIVTRETAQAFRSDAEEFARLKLSRYGLRILQPVDQYFVGVDRGNRLEAVQEIQNHPFYSQDGESRRADINYGAYPRGQEEVSNEDLYAYLVAAVAFMAVLCVYIMQLPAQVHSFAILRSIGITKGQLLLLALIESLLLAVPAAALGLPLGAALAWAALRLLMYSGSVPIQVAVPYDLLGKLFLLWVGVILLSRLVIFFITVRTPLTGRMQMLAGKTRQTKRLQTALIALMLAVFGTVAAYTTAESREPVYWQDWYGRIPDYKIESQGRSPISLDTAQMIGRIPGISQVEGFLQGTDGGEGSPRLGLSYEGLEERDVYYYMLDADCWEGTFDFGADKEAFQNGEIVLLCFGGSGQAYYEHIYGPVEEIFPCPGEKVLLRAYNEENKVVAEDWVDARVERLSENTMGRQHGVFVPYTIVFSPAYLEKFMSGLAPEARWGVYTGGGAFGYHSVLVTADLNATDLSTDLAIETFCESNGLSLVNGREEVQAELQTFQQELIMLFACGGCVAVVALLLFGSALALETERERRSFCLLRAIGMSGKQIRHRIFGKALARSVLAVAAGWGLTWGVGIWKNLRGGAALPEAAEEYFQRLAFYRFSLEGFLLISLACVLALTAVSVGLKRCLWKER